MAKRPLIIGVCGAGVGDASLADQAFEVGQRIAHAGAVLVCGGLGGVMEAACRGAFLAGGTTLGILPGSEHADANPFVKIAIPTGMGYARNVIIVQTAHVVIAIGGEYGTLSEIALARKCGRPVIGLNTWPLHTLSVTTTPPLIPADSPEVAVSLALTHALER